MPNILGMANSQLTDAEIIALLGGPAALARKLGIKPPSVHGWLKSGIPELRLIELAAEVEQKSEGRFTRQQRFPDRCHLIWPDLANQEQGSHA